MPSTLNNSAKPSKAAVKMCEKSLTKKLKNIKLPIPKTYRTIGSPHKKIHLTKKMKNNIKLKAKNILAETKTMALKMCSMSKKEKKKYILSMMSKMLNRS
jgi:hypothetical protein